ncbi:MAG TPA: glycosyltransferase [Acetobacteraceae bacterium]|nr:glycosyltransferase [Acetobacteraceae bacterium]
MGDVCASLSLPHRLWRLLPDRGRRRIALQAATLVAPRIALPPPPVRDGIIVAGELSRASGLGEGARLMLHALRKLGVACWPLDIGPLLPAHRADMAAPAAAEPSDGAALVLHVNPPMLPLVLARLPRALTRRRRVIGYWAWELPVSPPDWRVGARFVHEAWVPSQFTAAAIESLLPGRVRVVPHPVAASPPAASSPAAAPQDRAAFGLPAGAVVVLVSANLASSFARKDPLAAIATFRAAFGDRADRILVLKLGNPDHFAADYASVTAAVAGAPNIRLETRSLPAAEAHALTAAADIVLSLHRSEGFGLVLAEAMLLGKPVVATGWSGNMEFMNDQNAMPVPYRLLPVSDPRRTYQVVGAMWAEPDRAQAAAMLRRLADDPALRAAIGKRARSDAERLGSGPLEAAVHTLGLHPRAA